ncbi:MAG TPA: hypothetical protein VIZ64_10865 [Dokdonella sp.]
MKTACLLPALLVAATAFAQDGSHSLNDGKVRFSVPPEWVAVMQKTDGNPQAIAFQVPDPATQGSDDVASVTVKSRHLANAAQYAIVVREQFDHARQQPGYEADPAATDASTHRYHVVRGKTKYLVRDSFAQVGGVAVEVRCQRPLLEATQASWNASFDAECGRVVASLANP